MALFVPYTELKRLMGHIKFNLKLTLSQTAIFCQTKLSFGLNKLEAAAEHRNSKQVLQKTYIF